MTHVGHIKLTAEEHVTLKRIHLHAHGDHDEYLQNAQLVPAFVKGLLARNAIPRHRVEYFVNPDYSRGRPKGSHKDMFERNGNHGDEIMQHPHFLKYLRYFLFGADLPADVMAEFSERVSRLTPISSGDQAELWELARHQLNAKRLEPSLAAEEYFKLCLDCGVHLMHASHVREVIKKMRLRKAAARRRGSAALASTTLASRSPPRTTDPRRTGRPVGS